MIWVVPVFKLGRTWFKNRIIIDSGSKLAYVWDKLVIQLQYLPVTTRFYIVWYKSKEVWRPFRTKHARIDRCIHIQKFSKISPLIYEYLNMILFSLLVFCKGHQTIKRITEVKSHSRETFAFRSRVSLISNYNYKHGKGTPQSGRKKSSSISNLDNSFYLHYLTGPDSSNANKKRWFIVRHW